MPRRARDHPRSRGEYACAMTPHSRQEGSSPLSRGILGCCHRRDRVFGIIPALAGNTTIPQPGYPNPGDHPRSRGEYVRQSRLGENLGGSSPLSRGIRTPRTRRGLTPGIIPALAGNTASGATTNPTPRDHPRSRGEYLVELFRGVGEQGSSPLSRGIPPDITTTMMTRRIIPALAGNTPTTTSKTSPASDHPRSRGEYPELYKNTIKGMGSSPLSRGICREECHRRRGRRIIPALAGNTAVWFVHLLRWGDHPRSRGEYVAFTHSDAYTFGSSPLSRGIPGQHGIPGRVVRIIPALAGNTSATSGPHTAQPDHPRSRGEYCLTGKFPPLILGSSPLSRGILGLEPAHEFERGIIPALAGNTVSTRIVAASRWDHPRSRGEYGDAARSMMGAMGSSPLSRGIPQKVAIPDGGVRIIPALAGNTLHNGSMVVHWTDHPRSRGEYRLPRR